MLKSARPLVVAAVVSLALRSGVASAQTAIARNAPAGSPVELVVNGAPAGKTQADATGVARLPFKLPDTSPKAVMDVTVHVDVCDDVRRIVVVERTRTPPVPDPGCTRRDVVGVFVIRTVTSLVVDIGDVNATVWLRQGPVDLTAKPKPERFSETPNGLIGFGGAGIGTFRDAFGNLCGAVSPCSGEDSRTSYIGGATFWLSPFIAAEGAYLKPPSVNATGTGSGFRFNSVFSTQIIELNGKVGIPIRRARLYGQGGGNYTLGNLTTTETIDDAPVTVDGLVSVVAGGSQTIELKTRGWGWQIGGGLEFWLKPRIGVFGEVGRTRINGDGVDGKEGKVQDYLTAALFGIRVRIKG